MNDFQKVIIYVANTSQKHKEKKSQKRKDRQLRRQEKQQSEARQKNSFMVQFMKEMKGLSKSLPGFLAKNIDTLSRWLNDYCMLFQKADDAYIDYLKEMERPKRDQLVQDYVNIRVFLSVVEELKSKKTQSAGEVELKEDKERRDESNEEVFEQSVDQACDMVRQHQSVQVSDVHSV